MKNLELRKVEEINIQNENDLKEIAHWFGGWDELRKVIDKLEYNEKEADFERHYSDLNR